MNNSFLATHISNNYPRRMMLARDNINNAFNNNRGMNIRNNQFFNPMNTNNYNTTSEVAVAAVRRNKSPNKLMSSIEINDIQDRQMDKATSNKEEVSTKEREKGEIIDLISEDIAMEANKPDSNNTNKEEKVSKETERLEQLDVSIINQENIGNHNTPTNSAPDKLKKIEKHIRLMEGFESFKIDDLVNEIASIEVVTKLVNLLDVFPKL
ncbi:hypothetical protein H8356DRAFT_1075733 [Neocallimastix lanati (nom. inval.)]|nr:hypothetical protein H8356DRAFT_1075733 [Neocallimastix sp. JGI-2020a]